jgi:HlyD family secretion protein
MRVAPVVEAPTATSGAPPSQLPAVVPQPVPVRKPRWRRAVAMLAFAAVAAGAGTWWWVHRPLPLPPGIGFGNGRLEADPIDIATKFAGRIYQLRADEGDMVEANQVVAVMDTRDLAQSLQKAQAQVEQVKKMIGQAQANDAQLRTQVLYAEQEMERATALQKNGWITKELYDQRQQQLNAARAAQLSTATRILELGHVLEAANHDVELYNVNIADNALVAPRAGRIEYRIANVGEILPAGGKVFTMLDVSYVYMDVYFSTLVAGRIKVGDDARIVLDAYPDLPIPAQVKYVAAQAQFTPKTVETQVERDTLMFRVRVRIDPALLKTHAAEVRSGLPGLAYVRFDSNATWPERLQGKP